MYGKIHDSIFSSSLLDGKPPDQIHTAYVFMCMLTIADAGDDVTESRDVLAATFRVSRETFDRAIAELEKPDPLSRTPEAEGRRLVRLDERRDWGWHIVNRDRYKKLATIEERREYQRNLMRDRRLRGVSNPLAGVSDVRLGSRQEAVGKRQKKDKDTVTAARSPFAKPSLEEVTAYCRERRSSVDPQAWMDHYESNGWRVGRNPMKDWKAAVRTWERDRLHQTTIGAPRGPAGVASDGGAALRKAQADRLAWEREQEADGEGK